MTKIDTVYLVTHRYDLKFTQICLASIRYWYPEREIIILKNHNNGSFYTKIWEKRFNVKTIEMTNIIAGPYFSKFEIIFNLDKHRFMVTDNDCVYHGLVLDYLETIDADFIVDFETQSEENFNRLYFNKDKANKLIGKPVDAFFSFNMGQWCGTSSLLTWSDINEVLIKNPSGRYECLYPEDFPMYDQSVFNYLINKCQQAGKIKVKRVSIMNWPKNETDSSHYLREIIAKKTTDPRIIHWAGLKKKNLKEMNLGEVALFYQKFFFSKLTIFENWTMKLLIFYYDLEQYLKLILRTKIKMQN